MFDGGLLLEDKEMFYLEKIFKAIPHMTDFEKGRLFGIAEEMERQGSAVSLKKSSISGDKGNNPGSAREVHGSKLI